MARPFLKWAGGKRQMIPAIEERLPEDLADFDTYVEPFIGGGALMFHLLEKYDFDDVHISDVNPELTLCYRMIRDEADLVNTHLRELSEEYPRDEEGQAGIFFGTRDSWNRNVGSETLSLEDSAIRVARTIFLNKTCFNGLFRVNKRGLFNVPPNYSEAPSFPSHMDLLEVQDALEGAEIHTCSYEESEGWATHSSFFYLDPPYRPLPGTPSFVSYTKGSFNDDDQRGVARFCNDIDAKGASLLLSNSDPTNSDPSDRFFDDLFEGFRVERVDASRSINSKGDSRGKIREILVSNY